MQKRPELVSRGGIFINYGGDNTSIGFNKAFLYSGFLHYIRKNYANFFIFMSISIARYRGGAYIVSGSRMRPGKWS